MKKPEDIINFGKYKGKSFDEIADIEPSYILWLSEHVDGINFNKRWLESVEWDIRDMGEDAYMDAFMSYNDRY